MSTRDQILSEIEAFLVRHGMSAGDFGVRCMRNPSFVYRLRRGQGILDSSIDRARAFMIEYDRPLARRGRRESRPAA